MPDEPHIPYTVVSIKPDTVLAPDGHFIRVRTVTYTGPSGTTDHVDVPIAAFGPHAVDAMIQTELSKIEAVHMLGRAPASDLIPLPPNGR